MALQTVDNHQLVQTYRKFQCMHKTAEALGIHRTTVLRRLKALKINTTKTIALEQAGTLVELGVDAFQQIIDINQKANKMLDQLLEPETTDDVVQEVQDTFKNLHKGKPRSRKALALKVMAEIRGQLDTQLKYLNSLFDFKANAEFQKAVIDSIGEVAPDVKRAILDKLQGERAIRAATQFH